METYFISTIEALSNQHANLITSEMVNIRGDAVKIKENRNSYTNSPSGRKLLQTEVQEPYLSAVLAVWGDTPTVEDPALNMADRPIE